MRPETGLRPAPPAPLLGTLRRALAGGLVMGAALGAGTELGPVVADALGVSGFLARLIPAVSVSVLAVPLVVLALRRRGGSLRDLGFGGTGANLRALLIGAGVVVAAAALVLGAGTAAGLLRWSRPDVGTLAAYVVANGVVALFLEAFPEEATLRGYVWTSLRERFGGAASALGTTAVFLVVPGVSTVVGAGTARLLGREAGPVGAAPGGQDPVGYLLLLTVFGFMLVVARTAVRRAPLCVSIGAHLAFLTVNRIVYEGDRRGAGWHADVSSPDVEILVPGYLLVAAAGFAVWRLVERLRGAAARRHGAEPSGENFGHGGVRAADRRDRSWTAGSAEAHHGGQSSSASPVAPRQLRPTPGRERPLDPLSAPTAPPEHLPDPPSHRRGRDHRRRGDGDEHRLPSRRGRRT
ncbi:CPBP family glutamic-type intramembrane protease [Streptomyces sp. 135]|uniref:CPBP family glutamic-type intramembrane protease n=1 Tax=Streptomyces sp. 135 TaxID=2838850 RepID=UPI001CBFB617|nr:CPBP family glutamic-type intramembrane protease [Streptomyces sp. 135]